MGVFPIHTARREVNVEDSFTPTGAQSVHPWLFCERQGFFCRAVSNRAIL